MFENNPSLRASNERIEYTQEQLIEVAKCAEDVLYFAQKYCYIQTLDRGHIIPELRIYQKKIIKALSSKKYRDNKRNAILMAPRQAAKTTSIWIHLLHQLLFKQDLTIGIVTAKQETCIEIISRIREAFQRIPLWMQPGIIQWSKKSIKLANGSKIVSSAATGAGLRGYSLNILYVDEMAFIPRAEEFARAMFPTVAMGSDSCIIVSSTPNGLNFFSDLYNSAIAQNGNTDWFPMRVYEHEVPRPGGNEAFKKKTIEAYSVLYWNQEHECITSETIVTVQDKETGTISDVRIGDLIGILACDK